MMLPLLLVVLFAFGVLALLARDPTGVLPKAISCVGVFLAACVFIAMTKAFFSPSVSATEWLVSFKTPWIAAWNINFHLAADELSFWLIALTLVMTACALFCARPAEQFGSYYAAILWAACGLIGIFLSADVFLFFIFWEIALLPIYWMMIVHGNSERTTATLRFIVFTQVSGLLLLLSTLGLVYAYFADNGLVTFDYQTLLRHQLAYPIQMVLFAGFVCAFLIKLPVFLLHTWMPSVFSEAPAPILLVGILIKSAVFGLLRFTWPLFFTVTQSSAPLFMVFGLITVLYGAVLAFSQSEPRRFLAYSTLSHAGMLLLGVFCDNRAAYAGVVLLLLSQALSTGGTLMVIERVFWTNSRTELTTLGGLWEKWPRFSSVLLLFLLAGFGFPVFGSFVGEWSVLMGVFERSPLLCGIALLGVVLSAVYSLKFFQRVCLGTTNERSNSLSAPDLSVKEAWMYGAIALLLIGIGLFPTVVLERIEAPFSRTGDAIAVASHEKVVP